MKILEIQPIRKDDGEVLSSIPVLVLNGTDYKEAKLIFEKITHLKFYQIFIEDHHLEYTIKKATTQHVEYIKLTVYNSTQLTIW